jgi:hypothetical protein
VARGRKGTAVAQPESKVIAAAAAASFVVFRFANVLGAECGM